MGKNKKDKEKSDFLLGMLLGCGLSGYNDLRPYLESTGEVYTGVIHITDGVGLHDGKGNKIVWR